MRLNRYARLPILVLVLMALVVLACALASIRVYTVLNRSFPPSIAYDGGEVPGQMTVFPGYRIANTAMGCNRYYEISFGTIHGVLRPEMYVYVHIYVDGHDIIDTRDVDDFRSIVHDGDEIALPNPCTLQREVIGRAISMRPEIEALTCQPNYTQYLPDKSVMAQVELYESGWAVQLTKDKPQTNVRNAGTMDWAFKPCP